MARLRHAARSETGFTIAELMVVMLIGAIVLTLGAFAVRQFWLRRSLTGAQDQVVAQLREVQQRSMSETYPIIYGVRFQKDSSNWAIVRYNASTQSCQVVSALTMSDGIWFDSAATDFPDVTDGDATANCRNAAPATAFSEIVFFYPKGSTNAATGGSTIQLLQRALPLTKQVRVSPLTGRLTRT